MKQKYLYSKKFYSSVDSRATDAADKVFEILKKYMHLRTLVDLGCGGGTWILRALDAGVDHVIGIDLSDSIDLIEGNETSNSFLENGRMVLIRRDLVHDSVSPIPKADAVICLEVAEHLPSNISDQIVDLLCESSICVVFSAAQPGQGGTYHINEQPLDYWARKFAERGYIPFDIFRTILLGSSHIPRYYANNLLLFVKVDSAREDLSILNMGELNHFQIVNENDLSRLTSSERLRYSIVRLFPVRIVTFFSNIIKY